MVKETIIIEFVCPKLGLSELYLPKMVLFLLLETTSTAVNAYIIHTSFKRMRTVPIFKANLVFHKMVNELSASFISFHEANDGSM